MPQPVRVQISDQYLIHETDLHLKALRSVNGRKLRRMEKKLEKKVESDLQDQAEKLSKKIKPLFQKKSFEDDVEKVLDEIDDTALIATIIASSKEAMEFGGEYRVRVMKLAQFGITFSLDNPRATEYLESSRPLVLSKMAETTKEAIKPILIESQKLGRSYTATAKLIRENFAFSRDRSQMIAVNEIGHAYEYGNRIPMEDLKDQGVKVKKKWQTVQDSLVTPQCREYSRMGWIDLDEDFKSSNSTDKEAPRDSNPRCRCTTLYDF